MKTVVVKPRTWVLQSSEKVPIGGDGIVLLSPKKYYRRPQLDGASRVSDLTVRGAIEE
jgi:hypothetical protein